MAENIFNKTISNGGDAPQSGDGSEAAAKGTLIGNWYEERALRTFTGVGRTIVREHIPKKHLDFENPINGKKVFDNTHDRIYGEKKDELMYSENYHYGKGVNPADQLPKVGLREKRLEKEMLNLIQSELEQRDANIEAVTKVRRFDTTAKTEFYQKPLT